MAVKLNERGYDHAKKLESRAGQRDYEDIEMAVAHLHGAVDALAHA